MALKFEKTRFQKTCLPPAVGLLRLFFFMQKLEKKALAGLPVVQTKKKIKAHGTRLFPGFG